MSDDARRTPADGTVGAITRLKMYLGEVEREINAAKVLRDAETRAGYFFGISGHGLLPQDGDARIESSSSHVQISRVTYPASHRVLGEALDPKHAGGAIFYANLFQRVNFELYVPLSIAPQVDEAIVFSKHLASLLQTKTGCLLRLVAMAATPWDQMAACEQDLLVVTHPFIPERYHRTLWVSEASLCVLDLDWALLRIPRCQKLYGGEPSFRLAFDAASESPFIEDARTAIARIWSGIESLFDVATELSYRLSMYTAVLISDNMQTRVEIQQTFKRLYNLRSKAVHGAKISDAVLSSALGESWKMLCALLIACIEASSRVPDTATLDGVLLGAGLERDGGIAGPSESCRPDLTAGDLEASAVAARRQ